MAIDKKLGWWGKSSNLAVTRLCKVCKVYLRQVYWQPDVAALLRSLTLYVWGINILYSHSRSNQVGWGPTPTVRTGRLLERSDPKFWKKVNKLRLYFVLFVLLYLITYLRGPSRK